MAQTRLKSIAKSVIFFVIGFFTFIFLILYFVAIAPFFLYRWLLTKTVPFISRGSYTKAVTVGGSAIALDYLNTDTPHRCTTIVTLAIHKPMSYDTIYQAIQERWINHRDPRGNLRYPEFTQFPVGLLGYSFWKQDTHFDLKNHVKLHVLEENGDDLESEAFKGKLVQEGINRPWIRNRSPWEMHVVENYKNSKLLEGKTEQNGDNSDENMTLLVLRIHHSMVDGFALLHILLEQLAGYNLDTAMVATPSLERSGGIFKKFLNSLTFPIELLHSLGYVISWGFRKQTHFHVPDSRKMWNQLYSGTRYLSVNKIKFIKNTFGVGFGSVLNSACAAGLGKIGKKFGDEGKIGVGGMPRDLTFGVAFLRPNHPRKLRVHTLGAAFDAPITLKLHPVERLRECERNAMEVKYSPIPIVSGLALTIFSAQPAPLARFWLTNRVIATGITSFPGPGIEVQWDEDRKIAGMDFAAGIMPGCGGIGFMALSYVDKIHLCATAENAAFEQDELEELLGLVCEEVDILYELAVKEKERKEVEIQMEVDDY